jgi:hypothetical protein
MIGLKLYEVWQKRTYVNRRISLVKGSWNGRINLESIVVDYPIGKYYVKVIIDDMPNTHLNGIKNRFKKGMIPCNKKLQVTTASQGTKADVKPENHVEQ